MNVRKSNLFEMSRETACNTFFRTDCQNNCQVYSEICFALSCHNQIILLYSSNHVVLQNSLKTVPPVLDYGKTVFEYTRSKEDILKAPVTDENL